jgi:Tfp pilus assembly protein PilN
VRAVNLIPPEQRRNGAGSPGRAGRGVYLVLGALAAAVLLVSVNTLAGSTIGKRQADLERTQNEAAQAEQAAARLKPYHDFAVLKEARSLTVQSLARSRFDWERVMRELALVVPESVWVKSFLGTVAPGVQVEGGSPAAQTLRDSLPVPAVEIVGCSRSQDEVSRMMARLRVIDGVSRVSLGSSEKPESAPSGDAGSASSECGDRRFPEFTVVVYFEALAGQVAVPVTPGAPAPAAAATQPGQPAANAPANASGAPAGGAK